MKRKIFFYLNLTLLFIVSISCVHEQYRSVDTGEDKVFVTFNPTNILTTGTETQINKFRMIAFNSGGTLEFNKKQSEMDSPSKDLYKLELRPGMYTLYGIGNEPDELLTQLDEVRTSDALDAIKLGDVRSIPENNLPLIWKRTIYIRATGLDASVGQVSLTNSPDDSGWSSTLPMQMERIAAKISIAARKGNPNEEINMTRVVIKQIPAYTTITPGIYPAGERFYLNTFEWGGPKLITGDADSYTELVKGQIVAENLPATEARKTIIALEYTRNGIAESAAIPFEGNVDRNKLYQYQIKITGIKVEIENITVLPWNEASTDVNIPGAEISFSQIEVPYSFGQESKIYFTTKNIPSGNIRLSQDLYASDGTTVVARLSEYFERTSYAYTYDTQTKNGRGILTIKRSKPSLDAHRIKLYASGLGKLIKINGLNVAGSNIYWDSTRKQLAFDDTPQHGESAANERCKGVYFRFGSLTAFNGYSMEGYWVEYDPRYENASSVQRPEWAESLVGETSLSTITDFNFGTGDICRFMTRRGLSPGNKKWKLPDIQELTAITTSKGIFETGPATIQNAGNPSISKVHSGYRHGPIFLAASGFYFSSYIDKDVTILSENPNMTEMDRCYVSNIRSTVKALQPRAVKSNPYSARCVEDYTTTPVIPLYKISYDLIGSNVGNITVPTPEQAIKNQYIDAGSACTLSTVRLIASSLARHVGWEIDGKIYDLGATITNINKDLIAKPVWREMITKIGGLYWTNGNLIADGNSGCQIGDAMDGGLYFQFGSLIGWPGSSNSNGTGNGGSLSLGKPVVQPEDCNYGVADYTSTSKIHTNMTPIPLHAPKTKGTKGIGDPCRYYLGGTWRLPTQQELSSTLGSPGGASWSDLTSWASKGGWSSASIGYAQYTHADFRFIAAGNRNYWNGDIANIGTKGFIWSSSFEEQPFGIGLNIIQDSGNPKDSSSRPNGFPVRCVSNVSPY